MAPLALAACEKPFSTLNPAGPVAGSIATLWWVMLAGSVVLFGLTMALFGLVMLRPRLGARLAAPRTWILAGGLALPALVLPPLVAFALVQGETMLARPDPSVPSVRAEGFQWGWAFLYPDQPGLETIDVLHLPAGRPVDVEITSRDVIHSFWVPQLAGKLDAIPGHVNVLRLQADAPGLYMGRCAEFCGLDHAHMIFEVLAHPPEDYARALADLAAADGGAAPSVADRETTPSGADTETTPSAADREITP